MTLTEIIARLEELEQKAGNGDGEYVSFLVALRTHARTLIAAGKVAVAAKYDMAMPDGVSTSDLKAALAELDAAIKEQA